MFLIILLVPLISMEMVLIKAKGKVVRAISGLPLGINGKVGEVGLNPHKGRVRGKVHPTIIREGKETWVRILGHRPMEEAREVIRDAGEFTRRGRMALAFVIPHQHVLKKIVN